MWSTARNRSWAIDLVAHLSAVNRGEWTASGGRGRLFIVRWSWWFGVNIQAPERSPKPSPAQPCSAGASGSTSGPGFDVAAPERSTTADADHADRFGVCADGAFRATADQGRVGGADQICRLRHAENSAGSRMQASTGSFIF